MRGPCYCVHCQKITPLSIWTPVYTNDRPPPTLQVVGQQPRYPFSGSSSDAKMSLDTQCIPICIKMYTGSQNECADCMSRLPLPSGQCEGHTEGLIACWSFTKSFDMASGEILLHLCKITSTDGVWNLADKLVPHMYSVSSSVEGLVSME